MKQKLALALIALPLLAACTTVSGDEARRAEAYSNCRASPGPDARESCMKTQIALLEARDRREAERVVADQEAAERRQAEREAMGVPSDEAKEAVDSGLRIPK